MENKPICEIDADGNKRWWNVKGLLHREDGPAVEYIDGEQQWWVNGNIHRLCGPALVRPHNRSAWFINSLNVTDKIQEWAKENDIDLNNLTEVDIAIIKITWVNYGK